MKKYIILCLLIVSAAWTAAETPVSQYFNNPGYAFIAVEKPAMLTEDFAKTAMGKIWAEPEIQAFLAQPLLKANEKIAQAGGMIQLDIMRLLEVLKHLEGGIGLGLFDIQVDQEMVEAALVIDGIAANDQAFVKGNLDRLLTLIKQGGVNIAQTTIRNTAVNVITDPNKPGGPELCYVYTDSTLIVTITKKAMEKVLANAAGADTDLQLAAAQEHCGLPQRGGILAYADFARIMTLIVEQVRLEEGEMSEEYQIISKLRLNEILSIAMNSSISGDGFYNTFYAGMQNDPQGLARLMDNQQVLTAEAGEPDTIMEGWMRMFQMIKNPGGQADILNDVPKEAVSFNAFGIDAVAMWDDAMALLEIIAPPEEFQQVKGMLSMFETSMEISLRDDFIGGFNGNFLLYQILQPMIVQQIPDIVIKGELKNASGVKKIIYEWALPVAQKNGIKLQVQELKGEKVIAYDVSPHIPGGAIQLVPVLAVTEDALIISSTRSALLKAMGKPAATVNDNPEFTALNEKLSHADACSITFSDVKKTFSQVYAAISMAAAMAPDAGAQVGLDLKKLPLPGTISKHLFGIKSVSKEIPGGVVTTIYSPIDYPSTIAVVAAGVGGYTAYSKLRMAGAGMRPHAMEQPQDQRMAGPRAGGRPMNAKLKQLFNACTIYTLNNEGRFPNRLSELYPEYVEDLSTFALSGKVSADDIDNGGAFQIVSDVDMGDGDAILIHQKIQTGTDTLKAIRVDGTILELSLEQLMESLNPAAGM